MGGTAGNSTRAGIANLRSAKRAGSLNRRYNQAWAENRSPTSRRQINSAFNAQKRRLGLV